MSRIAKKLNLQAIDVYMGLFDFSVRVIVGKYEKGMQYAAHIFELKDLGEAGEASNFGYEARGKTYFRAGYVPIIWIPRKPRTPREHSTLAHEALHAVFHLFEWAALPMTRDTEEVAAHVVAHIVNETLERIK